MKEALADISQFIEILVFNVFISRICSVFLWAIPQWNGKQRQRRRRRWTCVRQHNVHLFFKLMVTDSQNAYEMSRTYVCAVSYSWGMAWATNTIAPSLPAYRRLTHTHTHTAGKYYAGWAAQHILFCALLNCCMKCNLFIFCSMSIAIDERRATNDERRTMSMCTKRAFACIQKLVRSDETKIQTKK